MAIEPSVIPNKGRFGIPIIPQPRPKRLRGQAGFRRKQTKCKYFPVVFESLCLRSDHAEIPGLYYGGYPSDSSEPFTTCRLLESSDGGVTYNPIELVRASIKVGTVLTGTTVNTVLPHTWDEANTLSIQMAVGRLQSDQEVNVLNGKNRLMVGGEVLGYQYARLTGLDTQMNRENVYSVSRLIRGLRGTEGAISGGISAGALAYRLDDAGIQFHPVSLAAIGTTRYYKVQAPGQIIEQCPTTTHTIQGSSISSLPPSQVTVTRDGSNNISITYTRRSRRITRLFGLVSFPVEEKTEGYTIDVLNPAGSAKVRQLKSSDGSALAYSAANQTTDGYTPGNPVRIQISQDSDFLVTPHFTNYTL